MDGLERNDKLLQEVIDGMTPPKVEPIEKYEWDIMKDKNMNVQVALQNGDISLNKAVELLVDSIPITFRDNVGDEVSKEINEYIEENNKYYTPDISEFHVGFEYEYKKWIDNNSKFEWTKSGEIRKPYEINWVDSIMKDPKMDGSQIRVKYLDKEDIESLGFKYDNNAEPIESRQDWEVPKLEKYELPIAFLKDTQTINGKGWYLYLYKDRTVWIEYIKDCCGMGYIFKGIIKNKSELIVLLKQLGIE